MAVYAPPNAAPWDDAVTMALNYAGIKFEKVWDAEVLGAQAQDLRLAAPAPRGLHRAVLEVLPQLRRLRRGWWTWWSATAPWRASSGFAIGAGGEARRGRGDRRVRGAGRLSLRHVHRDRDAGPRARGRRAWTSRRPTPTARRWIRTRRRRCTGSEALAFQNAQLELSPTVPVYSDIDGHQVNSPERRQPLGSFTLFNFSAKIDPVATMLVQNHRQVDPRFLRPHHVVHAEDAQARRHRAGRRAGRAVGQVHSRRARAGNLDVLRRARSRGSAAPDRRRRRPTSRCIPAFAGLPADPRTTCCFRPRRRKN